jgi:hypothetical protein
MNRIFHLRAYLRLLSKKENESVVGKPLNYVTTDGEENIMDKISWSIRHSCLLKSPKYSHNNSPSFVRSELRRVGKRTRKDTTERDARSARDDPRRIGVISIQFSIQICFAKFQSLFSESMIVAIDFAEGWRFAEPSNVRMHKAIQQQKKAPRTDFSNRC